MSPGNRAPYVISSDRAPAKQEAHNLRQRAGDAIEWSHRGNTCAAPDARGTPR
jgi:hypothetical protein